MPNIDIRTSLSGIYNYLSALTSRIILNEEDIVKGPIHDNLLDAVEEARAEWISAQKYFESVTDPDLVDHAIYLVEAAQRKYMYLLKRARQEGIKLEFSEEI